MLTKLTVTKSHYFTVCNNHAYTSEYGAVRGSTKTDLEEEF